MSNTRRFLKGILFIFFCVVLTSGFATAGETPEESVNNRVAEVMVGANGLNWSPIVDFHKILLSVSGPTGANFTKTFTEGSSLALDLTDSSSMPFVDGLYTYELRVIPKVDRKTMDPAKRGLPQRSLVQSGAFTIVGGTILLQGKTGEGPDKSADVLHYDDVIITGSLCIGFDCINGESFGYDTLKLKENNLRMYFEDTSAGSFPTGDWRIRINDTTSGGASYFALEDATNARTPFKIETGAPNNALYVEDYGRVGLGTSIPYVELHIVDGDSPTIRLDQDGSSGWAAQSWDLCGNETNFFVRDVTNGSKLSFRIQPNTPSNTLCLKADGKVGIGTWSPEATLEIETTGGPAVLIAHRTDGVTTNFTAGVSDSYVGSQSNHPLQLIVNQQNKVTIATNGYVGISDTTPDYPLDMGTLGNEAHCTTGGVWQNGSSRASKENINALSTADALKALTGLTPVKYNYKREKGEQYVGFIAEDVPELVATNERKTLAAMDIVAVLTKVVQQQQDSISDLKNELKDLKKQMKEKK